MIFVLAKMIIKKGKNEEFLDKTKNLIKKTRLEDGSISYNLYVSTEEENVFIMIEQWKNGNYLNEHLQTNHFTKFVDETSDILAEDIDIEQYSVN
ncbi:MAG: antibiotic biosynthesis monooxygenase [Methanobrevibacter sp.]|jgi:quinol monooxygenase YgiN|nr:antibiotic biosynthesis monooxygenase [Candidatus Methanovirga basalitermitum]